MRLAGLVTLGLAGAALAASVQLGPVHRAGLGVGSSTAITCTGCDDCGVGTGNPPPSGNGAFCCYVGSPRVWVCTEASGGPGPMCGGSCDTGMVVVGFNDDCTPICEVAECNCTTTTTGETTTTTTLPPATSLSYVVVPSNQTQEDSFVGWSGVVHCARFIAHPGIFSATRVAIYENAACNSGHRVGVAIYPDSDSGTALFRASFACDVTSTAMTASIPATTLVSGVAYRLCDCCTDTCAGTRETQDWSGDLRDFVNGNVVSLATAYASSGNACNSITGEPPITTGLLTAASSQVSMTLLSHE